MYVPWIITCSPVKQTVKMDKKETMWNTVELSGAVQVFFFYRTENSRDSLEKQYYFILYFIGIVIYMA